MFFWLISSKIYHKLAKVRMFCALLWSPNSSDKGINTPLAHFRFKDQNFSFPSFQLDYPFILGLNG